MRTGWIAALGAALIAGCFASPAPERPLERPLGPNAVVVELFTSQG